MRAVLTLPPGRSVSAIKAGFKAQIGKRIKAA
jgi:hypothetical protein